MHFKRSDPARDVSTCEKVGCLLTKGLVVHSHPPCGRTRHDRTLKVKRVIYPKSVLANGITVMAASIHGDRNFGISLLLTVICISYVPVFSIVVTDCVSSPCLNGGSCSECEPDCLSPESTSACHCIQPWTGTFCQATCSMQNISLTVSNDIPVGACQGVNGGLDLSCDDWEDGDESHIFMFENVSSLDNFVVARKNPRNAMQFQICIQQSLDGQSMLFSTDLIIMHAGGVDRVPTTLNITELNDFPYFEQSLKYIIQEYIYDWVIVIEAKDPDEHDILTYESPDLPEAWFILESNGTLKPKQVFTEESDRIYTFQIVVTDGNGGTASTDITVNVYSNPWVECQSSNDFPRDIPAGEILDIRLIQCSTFYSVLDFESSEPGLVNITSAGVVVLNSSPVEPMTVNVNVRVMRISGGNYYYIYLKFSFKEISLGSSCYTLCDDPNGICMNNTCVCRSGYVVNDIQQCVLFKETCPANITHGEVDQSCGKSQGNTCTFTCHQGYRADQSRVSLTCTETGLWDTDTDSLCIPVVCSSEITNGELSSPCNFTFGVSCGINCREGYKINPLVSSVICSSSSQWNTGLSDNEEVCQPVICPSLILNGKIDETCTNRGVGNVCPFTCKEGHTAGISLQTLACTSDGNWESDGGAVRFCVPVSCPLEIQNWVLVSDCNGTFGMSCDFRCSLNNTTTRLMCDSTAQWSPDPNSFCRILECASNEDARGTLWENAEAGTIVTKDCPVGYTRTGQITRTCSESGEYGQAFYNCSLEALDYILNQSPNQTISSTVQALVNLTTMDSAGSSRQGLYERDIQVVEEILQDIIQTAINEPPTVEDTEAFLQVVSNLIDETNAEAWNSLTEQDGQGVMSLIDTVDAFTELAENLLTQDSQSVTISTPNLALIVGSAASSGEDLVFPQPDDTDIPVWIQQTSSSVTLRYAAFQGKQVDTYSSTIYRDLKKFTPARASNNKLKEDEKLAILPMVITFNLRPKPPKIDPPIELNFELDDRKENFTDFTCVFWDSEYANGTGAWSGDGCLLVKKTEDHILCHCDHLTNFAVLMSLSETPASHVFALQIVSAVTCTLSIICLLITIVLHISVWKYVKSDRTLLLMHLCVALMLGYIVFLAGIDRTEIKVVCTIIAAVIQFIYLLVFFLMLMQGVSIALSVLYVFNTKYSHKWMLPVAYICPLLIVGISLGISKAEGYGTDSFCWLSLDNGLLYAFVGPAGVIIIVNTIILVIVIRKMRSTDMVKSKKKVDQVKVTFRSLFILAPLMGVTWVFGLLSVNESFVTFQYIFAICNGSQGILICVFHCVLNRQMKKGFKFRGSRRRTLESFDANFSSKRRKSSETRQAGKISGYNSEDIHPSKPDRSSKGQKRKEIHHSSKDSGT